MAPGDDTAVPPSSPPAPPVVLEMVEGEKYSEIPYF
jgi:hypothetical protein